MPYDATLLQSINFILLGALTLHSTPHVTIYSEPGTSDQVMRVVPTIPATFPRIELHTVGIASSEEFTKTLFVELPILERPVLVLVGPHVLRQENHRLLVGLLCFEQLHGLLRRHLHYATVLRSL